jgi:perosamine synthetase
MSDNRVVPSTSTADRLAINGGTPVRAGLLPYARQWISEEDIEAVVETLRSEWLTTGPRVRAFEEGLEAATGARHAVAFSSGTAALHGAAVVAGLGRGDEVITTPMTFAATANAILYTGADVVFADVGDPTLMGLDIDRVRVAAGPRTRAIFAVDYAGHPEDYKQLRDLASSLDQPITIVADASHSLGADRHGRRVGTMADLTTLSLHPAKIVTTGEGGAVLTDRDDYAVALRRFRNHGISSEISSRRDWRYEIVELGFNYRLSDIGAALGSSQMKRLPAFLELRRERAGQYMRALSGHWAFDIPSVAPDTRPAWHFFFVLLRLDRLSVDRGVIYRALRAEGIGVNVHYIPVHRHPYYVSRYPGTSMPVAEAAYDRLLTLPLFPAMTKSDLADVVAALDKVTTAYRAD